jgi:tetratricopeptide (TPR) repeat protein
MLLLPTKPEPSTLLNVAVYLLQSQPERVQEATELAWMIRNHNVCDTDKHDFKLLLIAEHLIKISPSRIGEAMGLIKTVPAEKIPCEVSMRLVKMLCSYGRISEAQALLADIVWWNSSYNSENADFLKIITDVVFELLRQEHYKIAKELILKFDITKIVSKEIVPLINMRLIFLNYMLFNDPIYEKQLEEVIADQNCPSVLSALSGYPTFLQRKAEYCLEREEERKAVQWLSEALLREFRCAPQRGCIINTVRWLVLSGQSAEAIDAMNQHYHANPGYRNGYTFLSLFFWISGDITRAKNCLSAETCCSCEEPDILFAKAVALGVIGEAESAVKVLEEVFRINSNFFIESKVSTIWGMFSLLLKAAGQEKLSLQAIKLAEKNDPLHQYRSHLYHRIPIGSRSLPVPPFVMPRELNS